MNGQTFHSIQYPSYRLPGWIQWVDATLAFTFETLLAVVAVFGGSLQFLIGLDQMLFCLFGVVSQLVLVCFLGFHGLVVRLLNEVLRCSKIAMLIGIDVCGGSLRK